MEACLPQCQQFEVNDAQAYLLERLGDIAAALKLYLQDIERCNAALISGVLAGHVLLPNVVTASGRYLQARHAYVHTSSVNVCASTYKACGYDAFVYDRCFF